MAIQDYIITGGKYGTYNHYQLLLKKLNQARPDIQISVLKFGGCEAISQIPRYEIVFTSATPDNPASTMQESPREIPIPALAPSNEPLPI